ncbi:hypothetical protein TMatcc_007397 [Talaromyces marneffei ATCC 18224]
MRMLGLLIVFPIFINKAQVCKTPNQRREMLACKARESPVLKITCESMKSSKDFPVDGLLQFV